MTQAALEFGKNLAAKAFAKRKGHGGAEGVCYLQMTEAKLAAFIAIAFEAGAKSQGALVAELLTIIDGDDVDVFRFARILREARAAAGATSEGSK